jgi:hypothetical protein
MKPHANHSPNKRAGNSSQVSQRQGDERSSSLFATSSVFLEESLSYHVTKFRETGASDTGFVSTSSLLREERSVGAIEPVVW